MNGVKNPFYSHTRVQPQICLTALAESRRSRENMSSVRPRQVTPTPRGRVESMLRFTSQEFLSSGLAGLSIGATGDDDALSELDMSQDKAGREKRERDDDDDDVAGTSKGPRKDKEEEEEDSSGGETDVQPIAEVRAGR